MKNTILTTDSPSIPHPFGEKSSILHSLYQKGYRVPAAIFIREPRKSFSEFGFNKFAMQTLKELSSVSAFSGRRLENIRFAFRSGTRGSSYFSKGDVFNIPPHPEDILSSVSSVLSKTTQNNGIIIQEFINTDFAGYAKIRRGKNAKIVGVDISYVQGLGISVGDFESSLRHKHYDIKEGGVPGHKDLDYELSINSTAREISSDGFAGTELSQVPYRELSAKQLAMISNVFLEANKDVPGLTSIDWGISGDTVWIFEGSTSGGEPSTAPSPVGLVRSTAKPKTKPAEGRSVKSKVLGIGDEVRWEVLVSGSISKKRGNIYCVVNPDESVEEATKLSKKGLAELFRLRFKDFTRKNAGPEKRYLILSDPDTGENKKRLYYPPAKTLLSR